MVGNRRRDGEREDGAENDEGVVGGQGKVRKQDTRVGGMRATMRQRVGVKGERGEWENGEIELTEC